MDCLSLTNRSHTLLLTNRYSIACGLTFFFLFYYVAGFQSDSGRVIYYVIFAVLGEFFATTLGQAVAALSPSIYMVS